ncbi:MAG: hypothetical protein AAB897_00690 [Patescibacteria group bacterium]
MNKFLLKSGFGGLKGKAALALLVLPVMVFAQGGGGTTVGGNQPPPIPASPGSGFCDVIRILSIATRWLFWILVILTIVFVLIAAFKYLTSAGDPGKIGEASKTLIYAAVAIAVALLATGVPLIVTNLLGITPVVLNCPVLPGTVL